MKIVRSKTKRFIHVKYEGANSATTSTCIALCASAVVVFDCAVIGRFIGRELVGNAVAPNLGKVWVRKKKDLFDKIKCLFLHAVVFPNAFPLGVEESCLES